MQISSFSLYSFILMDYPWNNKLLIELGDQLICCFTVNMKCPRSNRSLEFTDCKVRSHRILDLDKRPTVSAIVKLTLKLALVFASRAEDKLSINNYMILLYASVKLRLSTADHMN